MNKKLTHLFFAFILTIATLIPMFPQPVHAQSSGDVTFAAEQFNRRVVSFNRVLARARASMPESRILVVTSVALGISTDVIATNFINLAQPSNMQINDFILVLLIARSANIPVDQVVNACGDGRSFGLAITNLGIAVNSVEFRSLLFRLNGFMADLEAEISLQLGQQQINTQVFVDNLDLSLALFRERFNRFDNRIANFRSVFAEVLLAETGLAADQITALRQQFPNLTEADLGVLALAITSLRGNALPDGDADFIVGGIPMDHLDADVLFKLFEQRGIPVFAFGTRLDVFTRRLNLTLRTPVTPIIEVNPQNSPTGQTGF